MAGDHKWKILVEKKPAKENISNFKHTSQEIHPHPSFFTGQYLKISACNKKQQKNKRKNTKPSTGSSTGRTQTLIALKAWKKRSPNSRYKPGGNKKPL
jgi:hypothetical protein